ncbi:LysR substrate-binding domain-containing protein [Streptomyces antimycoticus]|uniref:LysR substrate-binding domain-containing protein n=1 Tax=Streptomyces antimycoticus TaxID=68175 RepID=UPI002570CC2E|nr:LysR substrate-binding domain-containing protein [Streptomyces antimycoticus]WJE00550.1 LysR substrate-binding domain-containing protein [Streptomyces antimycoticus]
MSIVITPLGRLLSFMLSQGLLEAAVSGLDVHDARYEAGSSLLPLGLPAAAGPRRRYGRASSACATSPISAASRTTPTRAQRIRCGSATGTSRAGVERTGTYGCPMQRTAAGVSRAAPARRFTTLVGEPPMAYPTGWRLALDAAPGLSLRLSVQEPEHALDELRKRSTDLALVHSYTVLPRGFPATCEQAVLMEEPVLLALEPRQAGALGLAAGQPADLSRLSHLPWLTPGPETSCYEMIQRACGAAGFVPDIRVRSSDFAVLTALVAAGAGAALVPRMALPDTTGPVSLHPLVHPVSGTVFTVGRAGTGNRPGLRHVLELLRDLAPGPDEDRGEAARRD